VCSPLHGQIRSCQVVGGGVQIPSGGIQVAWTSRCGGKGREAPRGGQAARARASEGRVALGPRAPTPAAAKASAATSRRPESRAPAPVAVKVSVAVSRRPESPPAAASRPPASREGRRRRRRDRGRAAGNRRGRSGQQLDRATAAGVRARARPGQDGEQQPGNRRKEGRWRVEEEAVSRPWEVLVAPGARGERRGRKPC
jgi:hypothetical protein